MPLGLSQMSSTSLAGASVITLQFTLALAIDVAEQEVQAAISGAASKPAAAGPAGTADLRQGQSSPTRPCLILGITSKTMALTDVEDLVDTRIAQKIFTGQGRGVVSNQRRSKTSVRVVANPSRHGSLMASKSG